LNTLGAVLYRAGDLDGAITKLNESVSTSEDKKGTAWDWFFLAMAHHRLGHIDEARRWLQKAVDWIEEAEARAPEGQEDPLSWENRLELKLFRREAESLLGGGGN
jgi:tetratricopeptide (TPR) repeat protein